MAQSVNALVGRMDRGVVGPEGEASEKVSRAADGTHHRSGRMTIPLELFLFVSSKKPAAVPADFEPVLRLPSLRHVKAGFGIKRLNEEFDRLASQHGKAWDAPDFDAYRARVALSAIPEA